MRRFPTGRGRPRTDRPRRDLGTPELIYKRAHNLTQEPLDACLERGFIDDNQHWSGIHFRWLYTLRYGTPDPTAIHLDQTFDHSQEKLDDPLWREAREAELNEAITCLEGHHLYPLIRALCVHHHRPSFLQFVQNIQDFSSQSARIAHQLERELCTIQEGLDILARHWGRKKPAKPQP